MTLKTLSVSVAALAFAASTAGAGEPAKSDTEAKAAVSLKARRVVRDKQTGKLRAPTEDELKAMIAAARGGARAAAPAPVEVQFHANGMRSAVTGESRLISLHGKRAADGRVIATHEGAERAEAQRSAERPTE